MDVVRMLGTDAIVLIEGRKRAHTVHAHSANLIPSIGLLGIGTGKGYLWSEITHPRSQQTPPRRPRAAQTRAFPFCLPAVGGVDVRGNGSFRSTSAYESLKLTVACWQ